MAVKRRFEHCFSTFELHRQTDDAETIETRDHELLQDRQRSYLARVSGVYDLQECPLHETAETTRERLFYALAALLRTAKLKAVAH